MRGDNGGEDYAPRKQAMSRFSIRWSCIICTCVKKSELKNKNIICLFIYLFHLFNEEIVIFRLNFYSAHKCLGSDLWIAFGETSIMPNSSKEPNLIVQSIAQD